MKKFGGTERWKKSNFFKKNSVGIKLLKKTHPQKREDFCFNPHWPTLMDKVNKRQTIRSITISCFQKNKTSWILRLVEFVHLHPYQRVSLYRYRNIPMMPRGAKRLNPVPLFFKRLNSLTAPEELVETHESRPPLTTIFFVALSPDGRQEVVSSGTRANATY